MLATKCKKCGSTENLIQHHVSYEPEIKDALCQSCHNKLQRREIKARFPVLRMFSTGVSFPKDIRSLLGNLAEIYTNPVGSIVILFPIGTDIEYVRESLRVAIEGLELYKSSQD